MLNRISERCNALVPLLVVLLAAGCGGGEQQGGAGDAAAGRTDTESVASVIDEAAAGSVSGTVEFQGTPPEPTAIDMSEEAVCAAKYDGTPMSQGVLVSDDGALQNVFVYVKDGLGDLKFPVPSEPVMLDQSGCRYSPRVFGIQVGQDLVIKNSDGVLHNVNAKPQVNRGFNISQPVVMETKRNFRAAEVMIPLECDVHGWMQAYAGVLEHPYYSVTGADGGFSLSPLPPGTYVIEAWHEVYGMQTQRVTVGENEDVSITFRFGESAA